MKKVLYILIFTVFTAEAMQAQRIVLIEQFTNSGCPPCAANTPPVLTYVDNHLTDVIAISYHTSFPYSDSMYFENPVESNARVSFYNVSSVPYSIVDGNYYYNTSANFNPVIANTINSRKAVPEKYTITNAGILINNSTLSCKLVFESLQAGNAGDSLIANIVVIEKNVLKNSYSGSPGANTETNYEYVMRKMLPDQHGTYLLHRNLNGKDTLAYNWPMQKIKNNTEIRIVAFVQNLSTKEIYSSDLFSTNIALNIKINNDADAIDLTAYPNPAGTDLYLHAANLKEPASISLINILGKTVYNTTTPGDETILLNTDTYSKGIYFAVLKTTQGTIFKKIILK